MNNNATTMDLVGTAKGLTGNIGAVTQTTQNNTSNAINININNPCIYLPQTYAEESSVWHVFVVRTEHRDDFQRYLAENKIQTIIHYPTPPHQQLAYEEMKNMSYPITEKIHREGISLPISPVMTIEEAQYVVDIVNNWHI